MLYCVQKYFGPGSHLGWSKVQLHRYLYDRLELLFNFKGYNFLNFFAHCSVWPASAAWPKVLLDIVQHEADSPFWQEKWFCGIFSWVFSNIKFFVVVYTKFIIFAFFFYQKFFFMSSKGLYALCCTVSKSTLSQAAEASQTEQWAKKNNFFLSF